MENSINKALALLKRRKKTDSSLPNERVKLIIDTHLLRSPENVGSLDVQHFPVLHGANK